MQVRRLRKLARHLRKPVLGHQIFDFNEYHQVRPLDGEEKKPGFCGYAGCALGELPVAFPESFGYTRDRWSAIRRRLTNGRLTRKHEGFRALAMEFFDLTDEEAIRLFVPGMPRPWAAGLLGANATAREVADSIDAFIDWKKTGRK